MDRMNEVAADVGIPPELRDEAIRYVVHPPTGTIHCSALKQNGEISGCTTTSGLAWKIPGRVGDSPIIGAGCYTYTMQRIDSNCKWYTSKWQRKLYFRH